MRKLLFFDGSGEFLSKTRIAIRTLAKVFGRIHDFRTGGQSSGRRPSQTQSHKNLNFTDDSSMVTGGPLFSSFYSQWVADSSCFAPVRGSVEPRTEKNEKSPVWVARWCKLFCSGASATVSAGNVADFT